MPDLPTTGATAAPPPNPAIVYLSSVIVFVVIASFAFIFGTEIWHSWKPPVPDWILALHNPLNALAALVGGIVAVAFAVKPRLDTARSLHLLSKRNSVSLGQFIAPVGKEELKAVLGTIYAVVYVVLGFAAIGTWAFLGSTETPADVKSLATTFAGMITPIVMAFFSQ